MSKRGLLKPEFNRVRTSNALQGNDMWNSTIGIQQDPQAGSNAAIENSLYAPQRGGGQRAMEKQSAAAEIATKAGYESRATDYKGLMALAKAQGVGNETRGACKLCGCLGHLTRKCTNVLSGHTAHTGVDEVPGAHQGVGGTQVLGLLPDVGELPSDLSSSSSSSGGSGSGSGGSSSDSDSHSARERKRRRKDKKSSKSSKKSRKEAKDKSHKSKHHKKSKRHSGEKKHKKSKRSRH